MKRMVTIVLMLLGGGLAYGQQLLMCGLSVGCKFVSLGSGIQYDASSNKLIAVPPPPAPAPNKLQIDMVSVNCSKGQGCPGGAPQTVFTTTKPVSLMVVVLRAISQFEGSDYSKVVNADGTWTLTFAQPADCGTVAFVYQVP